MWFEKKISLKFDEAQKQFPIEVLNMWDITELEIIGGDFTYFPPDIAILKHLKRFTLVSTKISHLPKELFEIPSLVYLNLKNNRINELPHLVSKTNIETLIMGRNYLRCIEQILPFLQEVKTLDLGHNQLSEITDNFFFLKNLQRLNLDSNKLKSLPLFLQNLDKLTHLSLEKNSFSNEEKNRIQKEFGINLRSDSSE